MMPQRKLEWLLSGPGEYLVAKNLYDSARFLSAGRCFAGSVKVEVSRVLPPEFLLRHSCAMRPGTTAVTGEQLVESGVVQLAGMQ